MTYLLMVLSWALFYLIHTALAASKLKRILESKWSRSYKWYRLAYSVFAFLLFTGILFQALLLPVSQVFLPSSFASYAGYMISTAGVIVLMKSMKNLSMGSFLGLRSTPPDQAPTLITSGLYAKLRHPLYFGLLLIFVGYFLVSGTIGALIHLTCLAVYLPVGIYFEEQNLRGLFGDAYRRYQAEVPAFFPRIHKKRG